MMTENIVVRNKKIPEDEFLAHRGEVLSQWPTGKEVDLQEAIDYHLRIPEEKVSAHKLLRAKKLGYTFVQPRAGVALVDHLIELLRRLQDEAGADFLPTTIDSYSRQHRYQEAQNGIQESIRQGRSVLNGFPAVNHGVKSCRRICNALKVPVQVRHGTPDARLLAEITFAGGFTDFEGGGITYNIPYAKNFPLNDSILCWQYVDRLAGYYQEKGAPINREPFGPLTGTMVPPCLSHCVSILEMLLAAEQGVKSISLGYGQSGNLLQDFVALKALPMLADEYLIKFGYQDVSITTVCHQWMGGFPIDEAQAFAVIAWGTVAGALARAQKIISKTPHEATGVPTSEANIAGVKTTKQIINMLKDQTLKSNPEIEEELNILLKETRCLLEKTLELGEGDSAQGLLRAFASGIIDIPFAPSRFNAGKAMPVRDNAGAVRFLLFGNLPFPPEIKEFHRQKINQRTKTEGRPPGVQMVIDDIYAVAEGYLVGRPTS